jgi:hypothetical protein
VVMTRGGVVFIFLRGWGSQVRLYQKAAIPSVFYCSSAQLGIR